ncbi:MAG TPA: hypothetical protein VK843_18735 [Planctomycetota bacterium]|nr:hypothetical protein [Planctomycetota bacterium]
MNESQAQAAERALERDIQVALAPLHKRCLGLAFGVVLGLGLFLATLVHMWQSPKDDFPLSLLAQYFRGYTVSFAGAFVALGWGFAVGFVVGWVFAFCRNVVTGLTRFMLRTRAELAANRGFLDQI